MWYELRKLSEDCDYNYKKNCENHEVSNLTLTIFDAITFSIAEDPQFGSLSIHGTRIVALPCFPHDQGKCIKKRYGHHFCHHADYRVISQPPVVTWTSPDTSCTFMITLDYIGFTYFKITCRSWTTNLDHLWRWMRYKY